MSGNREREIRALLAFYEEAGVDALVGEKPLDRFAAHASEARRSIPEPARDRLRPHGEPPQPNLPRPQEQRQGGAALLSRPDAAVLAARETARTAATLDELRAILLGFEGCALRMTATRLVFGDGNPQAPLMFVGEAPGREEDLQGLPFVGRSGQLLDRMMAAIGVNRKSAYVANIVPWRPPGNRTPTPQESAICLPFIRRQIELVDPNLLVCLGGPSAQALLNIKDGILKARGRWFPYQTGRREIRAMATLHPAYLLRQPLQKRLAWRDFLEIKKALSGG
jgi:DNA polymerase